MPKWPQAGLVTAVLIAAGGVFYGGCKPALVVPQGAPARSADGLPMLEIGERAARDTLCIHEMQRISVDAADPDAVPYVGKQFDVSMLPDAQGGGEFNCRIADRLPDGFRPPKPSPPTLSGFCLRRPGFPVAVAWRDASGRCAPRFDLANVPRSAPNLGASYPADGVWFVYEGRAPVRAPPCFTSELTVAPTTLPVGKTTEVVLTFTLGMREAPDRHYPLILVRARFVAQVGKTTIVADRPDDKRITGFASSGALGGSTTCSGLVKVSDLPAQIRFTLHVSPAARGSVRLDRVVWARRCLREPLLPQAVVSSPQARSVHYVAGTEVERFHSVTIKAE